MKTADLSNFRGKKIVTTGNICALICLTDVKKGNTTFFYMYLTNSTAPKNPGKRYVSKGDVKSPNGVVTMTEWTWAKSWKDGSGKRVEVLALTSEELTLAVKLAEEIRKNRFFGYNEENFLARQDQFRKKIDSVFSENRNR
jgi:hypothetical protein